jgi:hypothetical protein
VDRLEDIPATPNYGTKDSQNKLLLVRGDSDFQIAFLEPDAVVDREEPSKLRLQKAFWYAYGVVVYEDAFGRKHETRFGYVYHFPLGGDPRPQEFLRQGLPLEYNKAT